MILIASMICNCILVYLDIFYDYHRSSKPPKKTEFKMAENIICQIFSLLKIKRDVNELNLHIFKMTAMKKVE